VVSSGNRKLLLHGPPKTAALRCVLVSGPV
jgi:hypothetical protein